MAHAHGHDHTHDRGHAHLKSRGRLTTVLTLTLVFLVVEVVAGIVTGSLALLADAGHMLTDVAGLVLALLAMKLAERKASPRRTFGYHRAEILAALINAVLLVGVAGYILREAWERFRDPHPVPSGTVLVVAAIGLLVNVAGALLRRARACLTAGFYTPVWPRVWNPAF
jgi:cobalt-zinc-cadmium efflux system protein